MKKLLCILLVLLCALGASLPSSAYDIIRFSNVQHNTPFFSTSSGAYVVSYSGTHADIHKVAPDIFDVSLELSYSISVAYLSCSTAIFVCEDPHNGQSVIYTYEIDSDGLDSFAINRFGFRYSCGIACDADSLYLVDGDRADLLDIYSLSDYRERSLQFANSISAVFNDYSGGVYVISAGSLYRVSNGRGYLLSGVDVTATTRFIGEDILSDAYGSIFSLTGDRVDKVMHVDSDSSLTYGAVRGNVLYYPVGNTVYGYDLSTGLAVSCCALDDPVSAIYADVSCLILYHAGNTSVSYVPYSSFTMINGGGQNSGDHSDEQHAASDEDRSEIYYGISSRAYRVDLQKGKITGIPSGTTFAVFKSNMDYAGYDVTLYRNGVQRKSGNVGTAMQAIFTRGEATVTLELAVSGDITGEGNVNSRDIVWLMDYLLGCADFNGVYLDAADLSDDGVIDVVDLAMMKRI